MGLFDFFKGKRKEATSNDDIMKLINKVAFNNGIKQEEQEAKIVCDMFKELYGKSYSISEIQKFNRFANARFILRNFEIDYVLNESLLKKNIFDEEDLEHYFDYLIAKYEKVKIPKELNQMLSKIALEENLNRIASPEENNKIQEIKNFNQYVRGVEVDEIEESHGEFGYAKTNPISAPDILTGMAYLNQLTLVSGDSISFQRKGSVTAANVKDLIDEYSIYNSSGEFITYLYVSGYQNSLSKNIPKGFKFK